MDAFCGAERMTVTLHSQKAHRAEFLPHSLSLVVRMKAIQLKGRATMYRMYLIRHCRG